MNKITILIRMLHAIVNGQGQVVLKPASKEWHIPHRVSFVLEQGYVLEHYEPRGGRGHTRGVQGWEFVAITTAKTLDELLPALQQHIAPLNDPIWDEMLPDHTRREQK